MTTEKDRAVGALIGLAAGDAVGTTLEFKARGTYAPLTDMIGGGPFDLTPGQWTDDTSMALCLAASLNAMNGFDAHDQMTRYVDWYENGYMSSTGTCFDIGNTVSSALHEFSETGEAYAGSTSTYSAGNGSLMRLAPVVLHYYPNLQDVKRYAKESSRTTHGAQECLDACLVFAVLLFRAINGETKSEILRPVQEEVSSDRLRSISNMSTLDSHRDSISGSGYVVDCLEAAIWCFSKTDSFENAILMAANLGDDADTTAAVCGQLAGAFYGESGIPTRWVEQLSKLAEIRQIATSLYEAAD